MLVAVWRCVEGRSRAGKAPGTGTGTGKPASLGSLFLVSAYKAIKIYP